jgi:murein L,D-transpeptidase YcbB/YkuD
MRTARHRILASTGLALILALPLGSIANDTDKLSAVPTAAAPAEPAAMQGADAAATPANDPVANDTLPNPETATEQAAPPDPLASLDPADRAVAERIRDLLAAGPEKLFAGNKERAAAEAFYRNRAFAPLWLDKGVANARAAAVIARMKNADADGLEPSEYKPPDLAGPEPDALAEAELRLTRTVLTFARHLQAGRFPYTRVSRNIELPQAAPEPADILGRIVDAADAGKALDAFSPQHEPYRKLRAKLAELRAKSGAAKGDASRQVATVIANMERWRWYPRDLGRTYVLVNHPEFTLRVMHGGAPVWTTRIVVGHPSMPTPLLSQTMTSITINPTWRVPPSMVNDYLAMRAQDPTVLDRMGMTVSYSGGGVQLTQAPRDDNALGRIRFNIHNRFMVYQHDTPEKHMFAHEARAYSHGCMRIEDPAKYAEVLLNIARPREHWTAARITNMFGGVEQNIELLPMPVRVHLTYQTAFVDNAGRLQLRRDVYNLDSRTLAAIKSERGDIEPASVRKQEQETASGPRRSARPAQQRSPRNDVL